MAWIFVSKDFEPLAGIPLEAEDKDFEAAVEAYETERGEGAKGTVKKSGLYKHVSRAELTPPPEPTPTLEEQAAAESPQAEV